MSADRPQRIQRRRTKGWTMPENTVYVGRPSEWGNPYKPGLNCGTPREAVEMYEHLIRDNPLRSRHVRRRLRGKSLACWCPLDQPCHADVLLRVANEESRIC